MKAGLVYHRCFYEQISDPNLLMREKFLLRKYPTELERVGNDEEMHNRSDCSETADQRYQIHQLVAVQDFYETATDICAGCECKIHTGL